MLPQVEREIGGQGEAGRQSQVLSCLLTGPSGMALDVTRLRERLVGRGKLGDNLKCYHEYNNGIEIVPGLI